MCFVDKKAAASNSKPLYAGPLQWGRVGLKRANSKKIEIKGTDVKSNTRLGVFSSKNLPRKIAIKDIAISTKLNGLA